MLLRALAHSPYFVEYERGTIPWHMALGEVDGETVVVILRDDASGLTPYSAIRVGVADGRVVSIADYVKCAWILDAAEAPVAIS